MAEAPRISTYHDFWPFYLREHADPRTRLWHIAGTGLAVVLLAAAVVAYSFELVIAAVIAGYGPAWVTHFLVEKKRPATFRYPIWSLFSDLRMTGAWLRGTLDRELAQAGLRDGHETNK